MTFMDIVLTDSSVDINDYIEQWHSSESELPLFEYLGMTQYEYTCWVKDPAKLNDVIIARIALDDKDSF